MVNIFKLNFQRQQEVKGTRKEVQFVMTYHRHEDMFFSLHAFSCIELLQTIYWQMKLVSQFLATSDYNQIQRKCPCCKCI